MGAYSAYPGFKATIRRLAFRLRGLLSPRAHSVLVFAALFCTLSVKFFHSWRTNLINEYPGWILADISVLSGIELVLAAACFFRPRKAVLRTATIVAAVICGWSVLNAGWLLRTGTQALPSVFLPLLYDPVNSLYMVGVNIAKMPGLSFALFAPTSVVFALLLFVLAKPLPPRYSREYFGNRIAISLLFVFTPLLARCAVATREQAQTVSEQLSYNSQLRAVMSILSLDSARRSDSEPDYATPQRRIPTFEQLKNTLTVKPQPPNYNVVIVVLEGIQYRYTCLADKESALTPYLEALAKQGVEFTNTRSSVPHTTKALFALLTGRFPSASHDLSEAVPAANPYAAIPSILKHKLGFRTACFESAKGNFESWPGLIYNLGFDKFWAREDLNDPNAFVGYFGSDEYAMIDPIVEWVKSGENPFCLVIMCSVSHDPYVVPKWFGPPAKEPLQRYLQTISYTDKFLAALDGELSKLGIADKTILCVISDHGEAFGEHGLFAHERIAFDEVLRVPWVMRAPFLIEAGAKITEPVSSVDLTPTLLALLGFETDAASFDGINVLRPIPADRKVSFSCWMNEGPAGFVKGSQKLIYDPISKTVSIFDLGDGLLESSRLVLPEEQARQVADQLITWREGTIFQIDPAKDGLAGKMILFDRWSCSWIGRFCSAQYIKPKLFAEDKDDRK